MILQGPAELVLVSGSEARLVHGTLTARVPTPARGFTILSPRGKVVDLGTEFGLSVDDEGDTTVRVFDGQVAAFPLSSEPETRLRRDNRPGSDSKDRRPHGLSQARARRAELATIHPFHRAAKDRHSAHARSSISASRSRRLAPGRARTGNRPDPPTAGNRSGLVLARSELTSRPVAAAFST